jgi:hypothetical protein
MSPCHSVYTAVNEPTRPLATTKIAEGLTRKQATQLAANLRRGRESTRTMVLVYRGTDLRSAF